MIAWNENFLKKHVSSSRIGIEIRNPDGKNAEKDFITSETGTAAFPVIKPLGENAAFVAYTESVDDKDFVKYKLLKF